MPPALAQLLELTFPGVWGSGKVSLKLPLSGPVLGPPESRSREPALFRKVRSGKVCKFKGKSIRYSPLTPSPKKQNIGILVLKKMSETDFLHFLLLYFICEYRRHNLQNY